MPSLSNLWGNATHIWMVFLIFGCVHLLLMAKFSLLQNDDFTFLENYLTKYDFSPKNVTSHPHPICMTFCLDSWHYIKVHEFATSFYLNWRIYSKIKVEGSHKSYVEDNSRKRSHICADEEMQF